MTIYSTLLGGPLVVLVKYSLVSCPDERKGQQCGWATADLAALSGMDMDRSVRVQPCEVERIVGPCANRFCFLIWRV